MEDVSIDNIIEQVKHLSAQDKLELMERIHQSLKEKDALIHHLTDLKGVGQEIWAGIDAAQYVDEERNGIGV